MEVEREKARVERGKERETGMQEREGRGGKENGSKYEGERIMGDTERRTSAGRK